MNDTEKLILTEIRDFKKEVKVELKEMRKEVQANKESLLVFKAKWFGVGAVAIFVGNLIKPLLQFMKDNH